MATQNLTIDCQVHCYERNTPAAPGAHTWRTRGSNRRRHGGGDDAVGGDGAIMISPFSLYGYDASYVQSAYARHPAKFGLVRPFDPTSETIADDVAEWTGTPGVVGCRVMLANQDYEADHSGLNAIFAACALAGVPVNVMAAGQASPPDRVGPPQSRHPCHH